MSSVPVVHLHSHSWYSFGRGTSSPESLCAAAARQGVEALALTDLDGMYGVAEFLESAARHGVQPILGVSLPDPSIPRSLNSGRAVLLARDLDGYSEICRLVTRRHASPHTPLNLLLEELSDHVWVMTPDFSLLKAVLRVRGPDYLLAELRAGAPWERLAEEAGVLGVPSVGTAAVQLADASDRRFQRLLVAVHRQVKFQRIINSDLASERGWMLDEGAVRAAFSRWPEATARAVDVARDCRVGDLGAFVGAPEGDGAPLQQAAARLRHRVVGVAAERFGHPLPTEVRERLEQELETLCRGARAAALSLIAELAEFARADGMPAVADVPAAGSLVAWLLDLSPMEPLGARLPFEPFCNDRAGGVLRLDLRIAAASRPRLVERLRRELGEHRVARPGRIARWDLEEAVRDVARSAALPAPEYERVLRQLPATWSGEGPDELVARYPRLQGAGLDEAPWDRLLRVAARLRGVPKGLELGRGVLVAGGEIGDRVPLQTRDGRPVTQWDRGAAATMGMLSLELPDDRAASVELRSRTGEVSTVGCPELTPLVEELAEGRTIGCPGLEAVELRVALREHRPTSFDALLRVVAGVPHEAFAERRVAEAATPAGFDAEGVDHLLRVLVDPSARIERAQLRRRFVEGLRAAGVSRAAAAQEWDTLVTELPASPVRAAWVSTLVAGLRCLALRIRSPARFVATSLQERGGSWPLLVHVTEAVRMGIELRRPCVQAGAVDSTGAGRVVAVGLEQIRGVRPALCLEILSARLLGGRFEGLADFLARVPASDDEVSALIAAGALDDLGDSGARTDLRLLHRHLRPYRDRPRSGRRRRSREAPEPMPPATTGAERIARQAARLGDELGALGFTISGHPMEIVAGELGPGLMDPDRLTAYPEGARLESAGWVVGPRPGSGSPPPDRKWRTVLDAPLGLFDVAIPDRLVRALSEALAGPCRLVGQVRARGSFKWVEAEEIQTLAGEFGFAESA